MQDSTDNKNYKYYAFISYSHNGNSMFAEKVRKFFPQSTLFSKDDMRMAVWLQKKLESYRLPTTICKKFEINPKQRIKPIFRDEDELGCGVLDVELNKNLDASKCLIVLCSPYSAKPNKTGFNHINNEIKHFIDKNGTKYVIPVIINGVPNDSEQECFPPEIKKHNFVAIDVTKIGKYHALSNIVAKMLNLDPDILWQREKRRLQQRKILLSIISFILIALFLLIFGIIFAHKQEQVKYFSTISNKKLLPYGIKELSIKQCQNKNYYFKFTYKGYSSILPTKNNHLLRKVEFMSAGDNITTELGEYYQTYLFSYFMPFEKILFDYDKQGNLVKAEFNNGIKTWLINDNKIVEIDNNQDNIIENFPTFHNIYGIFCDGREYGFYYIRPTNFLCYFDNVGQIKTIQYNYKSAIDKTDQIYGFDYEYLDNGQLASFTKYKYSDDNQYNIDETVKYEREYGDKRKLNKVTILKNGNCCEELYFDKYGNISNIENVIGFIDKTKIEYLDGKIKLIETLSFLGSQEFDSGRRKHYNYVDDNREEIIYEKCNSDKKWNIYEIITKEKNGIKTIETTKNYNLGMLQEQTIFSQEQCPDNIIKNYTILLDANGQLKDKKQPGIYSEYKDNMPQKIMYLTEKQQPIPCCVGDFAGAATIKYEYEHLSDNTVVISRYFFSDSECKKNIIVAGGYSMRKDYYSVSPFRLQKTIFFVKSNNSWEKHKSQYGFAEIHYRYDSHNFLSGFSFYDEQEQLVPVQYIGHPDILAENQYFALFLSKSLWSEIDIKYEEIPKSDEWKSSVAMKTLPHPICNGYFIKELILKHPINKRNIKLKFTLQDKPTFSNFYASVQEEYVDGTSKITKFPEFSFIYLDKGKVLRSTVRDVQKNCLIDTWDSRNLKVLSTRISPAQLVYAFYDLSDCKRELYGIHKYIQEFDKNLNVISEHYYDINGNIGFFNGMIEKKCFSNYYNYNCPQNIKVYMEDGSIIEWSVKYDEDNLPIELTAQDGCQIKFKYNNMGQIIKYQCLNKNNSLISLSPNLLASAEIDYNSYDNSKEITFDESPSLYMPVENKPFGKIFNIKEIFKDNIGYCLEITGLFNKSYRVVVLNYDTHKRIQEVIWMNHKKELVLSNDQYTVKTISYPNAFNTIISFYGLDKVTPVNSITHNYHKCSITKTLLADTIVTSITYKDYVGNPCTDKNGISSIEIQNSPERIKCIVFIKDACIEIHIDKKGNLLQVIKGDEILSNAEASEYYSILEQSLSLIDYPEKSIPTMPNIHNVMPLMLNKI